MPYQPLCLFLHLKKKNACFQGEVAAREINNENVPTWKKNKNTFGAVSSWTENTCGSLIKCDFPMLETVIIVELSGKNAGRVFVLLFF